MHNRPSTQTLNLTLASYSSNYKLGHHIGDGLCILLCLISLLLGAVSLDSAVCADMAADILLRNGSAVDAAITGMLCSGAVHVESSGIGGGGFMTIRLNNGSVYTMNFRETAPQAATEDMFHSNSSAARTVGGR